MKTKKILIGLFILCIYPSLFAQVVTIPDASFKAKLLSHNPVIDSNNDNEIQVTEAENFTGMLDVKGSAQQNGNITDMTGLEAFINITGLNCRWNQISTLNTSSNTQLETLICYNNNISSINVSNNILLEILGVSENQLTAIDISTNINLEVFGGSFNSFTSLDFTNNPALTAIECYFCELDSVALGNLPNLEDLLLPNNNLTSIDLSGLDALRFMILRVNGLTSLDTTQNDLLQIAVIHDNDFSNLDFSTNEELHILECSNNESLQTINLVNGNNLNFDTSSNSSSNFTNLPQLHTVCLDMIDSPLATFILNQVGHAITFLEECNLSNPNLVANNPIVYPNPANDNLYINNGEDISMINIYTLSGSLIITKENNRQPSNKIDVSSLKKGVYFLGLSTINGNNKAIKLIIN